MSDLRRLTGGLILASTLTWLFFTAAPEARAQAPADWSPAGVCSKVCRWSGYGWGDGYHARSRAAVVSVPAGPCAATTAGPAPARVTSAPSLLSPAAPIEPVAEPARRLPVFPAPRVLPGTVEAHRRLPPVADESSSAGLARQTVPSAEAPSVTAGRPTSESPGGQTSGWWRAAWLGP